MSLARSWKCSYSGLNLVNLHSIFFLLKAASLKEISMQQNWSVCAARGRRGMGTVLSQLLGKRKAQRACQHVL